jgi:beta-D-xylosidase 4
MVSSLLFVFALTGAAHAYSFPDCVGGPLANTTVCNTSASPTTRAKALIAMFTTAELVANTVNMSPGVSRLGLPAYNWWSEALVNNPHCLH